MPIENPPPALRALIDAVDAAIKTGGTSLAQGVTEALRAVTVQTDWLPPDRRRANHDNYARHILWCDLAGRFSILSIVWDAGQQSPIHGHRTWCAVGVYQGALEECYFREEEQARAVTEISRETRNAGSVTFDEGDGVHRIANRGTTPAISIHVYGVGADRVSGGINRVLLK
jgi:predicted metal-dependent enzyme (double-stranded beta helix superfamily)